MSPESSAWGAKGTRIRSGKRPGSLPAANSHSPFRLSQSRRLSAGRGYSDRGLITVIACAA